MRRIQNNLFETICSKENLILAWRRVENSFHHGDVWFDELELSAYKFNLIDNIEKLSERMRDGTYQMASIRPAPYPKGKKKNQEGEQRIGERLCVRQSFFISVEDQIVWMAVYGVLGPYFEEEMPAWSYGNRLFLNTWKDEKGNWVNGVYRTTSKLFYRKWTQGWPLYRRRLAACIKRMAFPSKKDEEVLDDSDAQTVEENNAQVNKAFKLPYLEEEYFKGKKDHPKLYYVSIDLEKFYPSVKMERIRAKLLKAFSIENPSFVALINAITHFEITNDASWGTPFTEDELMQMDLYPDVAFDGLPTGLLVAGALANLYLLDVDLEVVDRLKREEIHRILHFRYVDDHLFLSDDKDVLNEWKQWYIRRINDLGLNVNKDKTDEEPIELDSYYPTPLLTQTLHKISEIASMPLDLLSSNEFGMLFRDLQMLLVTDFPEEEIKKSTRTSFACTMLSRLTSDIYVDYDKIHRLRKKWLHDLHLKAKANHPELEELRSLVFTTDENYPETLDAAVCDRLGEEGVEGYKKIIKAIADSEKEIRDVRKQIFNLLVYSIKEVSDKPKMWLRVMDFCIFHLPEKIQTLYNILASLHRKGEIHSLGFEYIVSVMKVHMALQAMKAVSRLSSNKYKDPWRRKNDKDFLSHYEMIDDKYEESCHYLYKDACFLADRVMGVLQEAKEECGVDLYGEVKDNLTCIGCLDDNHQYHGITLDESYWLLWSIERFNGRRPSPFLSIPNFLMEKMYIANTDSPYFTQLLFTCADKMPLSKFCRCDFSRINLTQQQKENLLLTVWGRESEKEMVSVFKLPIGNIKKNKSKVSLLQWIQEVRLMEVSDSNLLGNALCSEYCATLIMKDIVRYIYSRIEDLNKIELHPGSIFLDRKECLESKDWDSWISSEKKIKITMKKMFLDTMYRYPNFSSNDYSPMMGVIYGLGVIFLQLLTKEYSLPWVFNRPEYGYEWQSVLYRLLEKGKVSSKNYSIIAACLSMETRETIKLKSILNDTVTIQRVNDARIETIEELFDEIKASLEELKVNQISVAHHETRQLVMIKIG